MVTLYRGYDRAALDAQYNNRAAVPDHGDYLARWASDSASVRAHMPDHLDLAYGDHPRARLDVFGARRADGPAPALLFIHGGYWQALDKESFSFPAPALTAAGIAYVPISYPLAPDANLDEIVENARQAVAWLWKNGDRFGIDTNNIFVAGHSAGGHLTAMMMGTDWPSIAPDLPADLVTAGCAISGLYDLEPIRLAYLNDVVGLDSDMARRNSPIHYPPDAAGTLLLVVGEDETDEFRRQQSAMLEAWRGHELVGVAVELPALNHFSVVDGLADPRSPLFKAIEAMVLGADERP